MGNMGFLKNIPGIKQLMQLKDMKNMFSGGGFGDLFSGGMPPMGGMNELFGQMPGQVGNNPQPKKGKKQPRTFKKVDRNKKRKIAAKSRKKNRKKK